MPFAFENVLAALFADPNIGRDVIYTPQRGTPITVRAVLRRPDEVTNFGDARLWSETTRLDLRVPEVPAPRPGDHITIDGEAFEPVFARRVNAGVGRRIWFGQKHPFASGAAFGSS